MSIIVLHEYEIAYLSVPKAACTSIKYALCRVLGIDDLDNIPVHSAESSPLTQLSKVQEFYDQYADYFTFTFVRNPWDRIVSCYSDKILRVAEKTGAIYEGFQHYGCYQGMSFEEFVKIIAQIEDSVSDRHFRSQHALIALNKQIEAIDFIGKFEDLHDHWEQLKTVIPLPDATILGEIPHKMKSQHTGYQSYYTPELQDLITKRYQDDITLFQYSF